MDLDWRNDFEPTRELRFRLHLNAWRNAQSTWMRAYLADSPPVPALVASDYGAIDVQALTWRDRGVDVDLSPAMRFVAASAAAAAADDDGNPQDRTVLTVALPRPIGRGEVANLSIAFNARVPRAIGGIGAAGRDFILAHWAPQIGVFDQAGWRSPQAHPGRDVAADEADFEVHLTVPGEWQIASTGRRRASNHNRDGTATHAFVQNAVRDFAWAAGPAYVERVTHLNDVPSARGGIDVRVLLQPEHTPQADRVLEAAREALDQYGQWFTPYPDDHLTIVDVPWRSGTGGRAYPRLITVDMRWLSPAMVQNSEAQVARGIARQWWGGSVGIDHDEDVGLAASLAEYAQSRTLERLFDRRHALVAYSTYESRYFGGFIPWTHRDLRLRRETDGLARSVYRSAPEIDNASTPGRPSRPSGLRPFTAKAALALASLERYIGWPALQRGLAVAAARFSGRRMTSADLFDTLSEAAGQDLIWFFDESFSRSEVFDYAVDQLRSERETSGACAFDPCYRTTVVVRRHGGAVFTGTSQEPVGAYEAGRALEIRVAFADRQQLTERWDGRARSKTLVYQSPVPALSAEVDPNRTLLLDLDYVNNSRTLAPVSDRAAVKWSVKWLVWLQDFLLTYAFLI